MKRLSITLALCFGLVSLGSVASASDHREAPGRMRQAGTVRPGKTVKPVKAEKPVSQSLVKQLEQLLAQ